MRLRCLLIAPLLLVLCACSKTVSVGRTPPPQANLFQRCPDLPPPPTPLLGQARDQWEADLIALYGDCAARHLGLARSWPTDK